MELIPIEPFMELGRLVLALGLIMLQEILDSTWANGIQRGLNQDGVGFF